MAEFTKLTGAQRPYKPVQTPSGSEGKEAISEVFGKVAAKAMDTVVEINNEKSNASLYQATNQIYRLKHVIQSDFLKNPDQISPLMDGAISDVKQIVSQTPMNSSDRKRLEYLAENDITDIEATGIKLQAEHARTQGTISFVTQWPEKLQQIQDAWNKGEKDLDYQYENSQKLLSDALSSGFITLHQYESMQDTLHETVTAAKEAHDLLENEEEHTAKNYHRATTRFDQRNTFNQVGAPSNEATNFLYNHERTQRTFSDVMAAIYNGRPADPLKFMNLSKKEREEVKIARDVIRDINAEFMSGGSWDAMEAVHQSLDAKKDVLLSTEERAAKTYLDNFFDQFTSEKYLKMMSMTPIGAQATQNHHMRINAVDTNKSYSPEQKESLIRDFDNQFVDDMVSVGIAKNIPQDKIMPIAAPIIQKAQSSFELGGDPMALLQTIDHYNQRNRIYVAQAMKDPIQKEIAYSVGLLEGKTANGKRQELIAANQKGIDFSPLNKREKGEDHVSEGTVFSQVASELDKINEYNSRFKANPGEERAAALNKSITNAVRYASLKRGEFDLKNYKKDIDDWKKEISKGYDIYSGDDYAFNKKQQPQVSNYEWASVANYAKTQAYARMKEKKDVSHVDLLQTQDINPLYVTITPDNYIIAQDQYGNAAFSQQFSDALVSHAVVENRRLETQSNVDRKKLLRGSDILKGMRK